MLDTISYNTVLSSCGKGLQWQTALQVILSGCWVRFFFVHLISYNTAISSCEKGSQWRMACHLLEVIHRNIAIPDVVSYNALISSAEKGLAWQWVLELLLQMSTSVVVRPDVLSYNAVISSCEKGLQWQWALHCYTIHVLLISSPGIITYNSLLTAFDKSDAPWPLALNLFSAASSAHVAPDALTFHAAVRCCCKGQGWERALELLAGARKELLRMELLRMAKGAHSYRE
ncbi:Pentatricopeptide repeat-containing protein At2g31400 [Durusdinium trenchii]|uniref:Chloroplastic n=1 Tax=Durusdinium trenchii TaxID=1381693 RepID=A0ABP0H971_9DINO